ncbi:hypothetical protein BKA58DRAFT_108250 [Alternaria rosae]|uniref:uncharacterized protein n=1 Tax=Alternaria rosae TaxID=1187941 RepID=UPI001E8CC05E|nr:uncharacterized protein BKA58DRAFT_108250 [Alternaria rosae]KAH6879017.1 hypothetical protein BKA58DRAFT_108250 [Alternaria rosae]
MRAWGYNTSPEPETLTALSRLENGVFDVVPKVDWQKSIAERSATESPLLRLPRELRDLIWTFTLTTTVQPWRTIKPHGSAFNVLQVCRQAYTEAISLTYPFITWSFICMRHYEDFFWKIRDGAARKKESLVHSIQIGADPSDLYMLAEIVDPGTDEDEQEEGQGEYDRATFRAFENLSHLELLLSATGVFYDSEKEDDLDAKAYGANPYEVDYIEEARDNFNKTMERKVPRVRVTYKDFDDSLAMERFWCMQSPREIGG